MSGRRDELEEFGLVRQLSTDMLSNRTDAPQTTTLVENTTNYTSITYQGIIFQPGECTELPSAWLTMPLPPGLKIKDRQKYLTWEEISELAKE